MLKIKMKMTTVEINIVRQSLDSIGWDALPTNHPDRKAAQRLKVLFGRADKATLTIEQTNFATTPTVVAA